MSTSLLYHGFGLVGYQYVNQRFHEGQVTFRIRNPVNAFAARNATATTSGCAAMRNAPSACSPSAANRPS